MRVGCVVARALACVGVCECVIGSCHSCAAGVRMCEGDAHCGIRECVMVWCDAAHVSAGAAEHDHSSTWTGWTHSSAHQ
jgi:hypothetical protein